MKKNKNKVLLFFMVMLFCIIPLGKDAWAAKINYSGISDDLKWTIDSDGVLTISGTGDYDPRGYYIDFDYAYVPDWIKHKDIIRKAVVKVKGITSTEDMFVGCENMTQVDLSGLDTSKVRDMSEMFRQCEGLETINVSKFNTSRVKNMSGMFIGCRNLSKLDLSAFDTANVRDMSRMFGFCENLTNINLKGFDTSKVKDMSGMFSYCSSLKSLDLSGFDTSSVTQMGGMFSECKNLSAYLVLRRDDRSYYGCFDNTSTSSKAAFYINCSEGCSKKLVRDYVKGLSSRSHIYFVGDVKVKGVELSNVAKGIKIQWKKKAYADGYSIYRKESNEESFKWIKSTSALSFVDEAVNKGSGYEYKIKAYYKVDGKKTFGAYSNTVDIYRVKKHSISKLKNDNYGVAISWKKLSNVDGYYVYRKTGSGKYKKVYTAKKNSITKWTDEEVENGKKYTYAITPYLNGSKGERSSGKTIYFLKSGYIPSAVRMESGDIKITWKKIAGASGYQIRISTKYTFDENTYRCKVSSSENSVTFSKAKKNKYYYIQVRPYKKVDSETYYGAWSSTRTIEG